VLTRTFHHPRLKLGLVGGKHDMWALLHHEWVVISKGVTREGVGGCGCQVPP